MKGKSIIILAFQKHMDFELEIYLLRHAMSIANEKGLVCGSVDFPLSKNGIVQADLICKSLKKIHFTLAYTSPLSRAIDTIKGIMENLKFNIVTQISELDTGDASRMTLENLWKLDDRYRAPWLYPYLRYPSGECFNEMVSRIQSWFLNESQNWKEDDTVLIVGHEGTIRTILMSLFKLDLSEYPEFPIKNCDCFHIFMKNGFLEEAKHLTLEDIG